MTLRMLATTAVLLAALAGTAAAQATTWADTNPWTDAHDRATPAAVVQDAHDRGVPTGPAVSLRDYQDHPGAVVTAPATVLASDEGFDWGDATIGAAAGLGAALLLAGGAFVLGSQRGRPRVATR
jgi:hypothetical protein